ncbi:E3 ubiquitin-protein ligase E3D isoform X10 [Notamacropus eugenii]|uniref:E3 ubiquitin-protein ligase E3D isoform X10 n=1 Tax=Notamacropus eugenii TaxID=9315 RepID=UPI003B672C92
MDMFLEIRKRLQNALLIIREPKQGSLPVDVSITPSVLKMKTLEQCREINFPPEVRLVPSSLRGLQYVSGDGIHMRLLVQADLNKKLVSTLNQSLETPKCYVFYCQSCGEIILKERKLLRVLPLPSGNWNALVEEWCCHPDPFSNKPLNPGVNDCFIGDTHLLVNLRSDSCAPGPEIAQVEIHQPSESYLESKPKANTKIICKRCKAMLGESGSSGTTKFYITEIIIQPSGRDFDMIPRLASSWENDIGVHSLVLPSQTCLELLLILSRSNDSLPPSLQYMNSFQGVETSLPENSNFASDRL